MQRERLKVCMHAAGLHRLASLTDNTFPGLAKRFHAKRFQILLNQDLVCKAAQISVPCTSRCVGRGRQLLQLGLHAL